MGPVAAVLENDDSHLGPVEDTGFRHPERPRVLHRLVRIRHTRRLSGSMVHHSETQEIALHAEQGPFHVGPTSIAMEAPSLRPLYCDIKGVSFGPSDLHCCYLFTKREARPSRVITVRGDLRGI